MKGADLIEQYKRFPNIQRSDVQKFLDWIHAQPHIDPDFNELDALHFYHACKGSMENAKQVLDINLTVRTHCGEFFSNLDIDKPEIKKAMNTLAIVPLPDTTPEGYRVIVSKLLDTNASNFNYADTMKLSCMIYDFWMYEDGIRPGHIIVMDLKGASLSHLTRVSLMQIKKFLYYLQEAAAINLVGFHFINIVPFMDKILALMNPFLKKELSSMLYMHSNLDDFYKFVPQNMLPKDYGGNQPECNEMKDIFYKKLQENRDEMLVFEKRHQVNEKLRPGKAKNQSQLFGIEGNFKKLNID